MICEGCKKPIDELTIPAQVVLLPHGRTIASIRPDDVSRFCTLTCLRDWCNRILEIG